MARQLLDELTQRVHPGLSSSPVSCLVPGGLFIFNIVLYKYTEIENIKLLRGCGRKVGSLATCQH